MTRLATAFAPLPWLSFKGKTARSWRAAWVGVLMVCLLALQALALTHHHEDAAAETACNVCHVIQHQPLHESTPPAMVAGAVLVLLCVLPRRSLASPARISSPLRYLSRAPPRGCMA
jgi:hypothetical protein